MSTAFASPTGAHGAEEIGDWFALRVLSGLDAPLTARQAVAERAATWVDESRRFTLDLLLTEIVTNAVRHGSSAAVGGAIEVEVALIGSTMGVEVTNAGRPLEHDAGLPADLAEQGRGLALVDALADRWGSRHETGRTTVWFELEAGASPAQAA